MLASSAAEVKKWKDAGALLLAYSSDVEMLHGGFSAMMRQLKG
jgi:2-dehydro-3-deoxyglucarate aldolase/4-hydroxy-2-oxoheptanedioate aldolase